MSVQDEIDRLVDAKASLKTSITNKGVSVSDTATLSEYSSYVDAIAAVNEDDFVKKSGDTMTGALTTTVNGGEALRAQRTLSGTTRRIYMGLRNDGSSEGLNGQIEVATNGNFDERTGIHFKRDGLYQTLGGNLSKLATEGKGLDIPIPATNFPNNTWTGIRLRASQHCLWLGLSDSTSVGQIEYNKANTGTTALRFKSDGLYQKVAGVETKLATMADVGTGGGGGSINFENCGTAALMRRWNNDYGMYETIGYSIHNKILPAGKYLITCDFNYYYYMGQDERIGGTATVVADLTGVVGNVDSFTAKFIGSTDYSNEGGNMEYYLTEVEFNVNYHSTMGTTIDIPNLVWDEYSPQNMEAAVTFIKIG